MLKKAGVIFFCLLTGCQSVGSKIADLPSIGFDPVMSNKSDAYTDGKVTFLIESSGTDVWLLAKNGTTEFIELSDLNLAGSRCTYSARGKQLIAPSSVSMFTVPTVGLLGLCYDNNDQLIFINNAFTRISQNSSDGLTLPLLFSIKYEFPGSNKTNSTIVSQSLNLAFLKQEQS
ncbi:TPA: hypothetical protein ACIX34_005101 [Escherichia coli]|uniref:hypothetical protein n=1 Tax=Escherichia coli TaxID=562 RepID=UPI000B7D12DE|nr:hypothetical protein [Escherichia coli]EFA4233951.1 hypothetical protein [Escherichia coli O40:H32]EFH7249514.1 hypothetical protein [Escherichia coli]EFO2703351.1 hypothetical protein [Escherichia coli]EGK2796043.1 hypothetical protein [Escherichia coli]MBB6979867.1 hypothetical protein [Escherichia coli]